MATSPGRRAINGLAVGVEADEATVGGNVHTVFVFLAEDLESAVETVLEQIGHHRELDRAFGRIEGVGHRAAAAATAADERQANGVILGSVDPGNAHARKGRSGGHGAAASEEFAAGEARQPSAGETG